MPVVSNVPKLPNWDISLRIIGKLVATSRKEVNMQEKKFKRGTDRKGGGCRLWELLSALFGNNRIGRAVPE